MTSPRVVTWSPGDPLPDEPAVVLIEDPGDQSAFDIMRSFKANGHSPILVVEAGEYMGLDCFDEGFGNTLYASERNQLAEVLLPKEN